MWLKCLKVCCQIDIFVPDPEFLADLVAVGLNSLKGNIEHRRDLFAADAAFNEIGDLNLAGRELEPLMGHAAPKGRRQVL